MGQAFRKSDFDCDGLLNEFETNHFGYLLFWHKNHGALYSEMCSYCDSNPLFGLNFENILSLFPHTKVDEKKKEKQKKKDKHKKKKKKQKSEKKKQQKADKQKVQKKEEQEKHKAVEIDDLDIENWGELPPSEDNNENDETSNEKEVESSLLHIRGISAFVMSGLADSSDSDKEVRELKEQIDEKIEDESKEQMEQTNEQIFILQQEVSQWMDKYKELEKNKKKRGAQKKKKKKKKKKKS